MSEANTVRKGLWRTGAAIVAALGIGVAGIAPAFADDWHDHGGRGPRHEWREHEWREHHHPVYVPPPVVVAPAPRAYYVPPPAVVVPPPAGLSIVLPINIR